MHGLLRAHAVPSSPLGSMTLNERLAPCTRGAMWLRILNSQTRVQIFDLATSSPLGSMTLDPWWVTQ